MTTRQTLFGWVTGIGVALLGAMLAPLDPAGWHLMAVGVAIGALTLAGRMLQPRLQAAPVSLQTATEHGH